LVGTLTESHGPGKKTFLVWFFCAPVPPEKSVKKTGIVKGVWKSLGPHKEALNRGKVKPVRKKKLRQEGTLYH